MRRAWWVVGLAVWLGGCAPTALDRMRDYNDDGVSLYRHGRLADARDSFQAALALAPEDAGVLYNLGQCYDRLGNPAKAEHYYNECLQRSPNHAACRHGLATLLVSQGRQPEAVRMIQDWLVREPKRAAAYAEDGWLWRQAGDLPRAQARFQQALDLDAHDNRALTELALIYEETQRPERAVVLYEHCLEQNPDQPDVAKRLHGLLTKGVGRPRQD